MNSGEAARASVLRIALVSETWFPQVNGVSRSLEKLVESLVGCGDTIRLFIPRYPESHLQDGVSAIGFRAVPLPFYPEVRLPVVTPATVARELASFRPDVVHIATEGPLGWAALRASRRLGLRSSAPITPVSRTTCGSPAPAGWRTPPGATCAASTTLPPPPSARPLGP
jgi:hypothetical protein